MPFSIQPAGSVLASSVHAGRAAVLLSALQPPAARRAPVVRMELLDRLLDEVSAKLVLVVAPAGWGKTSLLRDWRASGQASATAWLSADPADNDPGRFWTGVITALRTVCPGAGTKALRELRTPGRSAADGVLASLINDLAGAAGRVTLVIDDFHLIINEEIKQSFAFLVDHLPVTLGLVVATRRDPDLPLARMRARGELAEFRAEDLRFSEAETADLLNGTLGLALPPEDVRALHQRTEGWAAGLYLAGQELLEELERAQLFLVPPDTTRQWYRYHTLFAEWLRCELDRSEPGLAAQLHRHASAWHREHGSITDAVEHAVRANSPSGPGGLPDLVEPLTCREREVLDLLAEGKPNRGIADELVVTLDTVKRHVSHILAKLGAVNRTEAVARARARNLIP